MGAGKWEKKQQEEYGSDDEYYGLSPEEIAELKALEEEESELRRLEELEAKIASGEISPEGIV